jgi:AraC-like DNA-binding protein
VASDELAEARWTNALGGAYLLHGVFHAPFGPHVHTRYIVGVVDRGTVVISRGKRSWVAMQGDLIRLRPHEVHEDQGQGGLPWTWRLLYARPDAVWARGWRAQDLEEDGMEEDSVIRDSGGSARFSQLFDAMWRREAEPEAAAELADLVRQLFERRGGRWGRAGRDIGVHERIALVRRYLHAARPNAVSIPFLAGLAQLSPFHMIRKFHAATGLPPHAYYQQVRIAEAKEMLWQGRALSEIAFGLGFSDQSHFCREFKRTTQVTPGQYAAMVRASGIGWATRHAGGDARSAEWSPS